MSSESAKGSMRKRISVPLADESVVKWIETQSDLSASVRHIIREIIQEHGYTDVMCTPVEQRARRGRRPGQAAAENAQQESVQESFSGFPSHASVAENVLSMAVPYAAPAVSEPVQAVPAAADIPASSGAGDMLESMLK